jgi:hypothetical protein
MSSNALVVYRPRHGRRWGWLLLAVAMLTVAVLASLALFDAVGMLDGRSLPVTVVIDGEEIGHGFDLAAMTAGHKLALFLGVMLTVLLLTLIVTIVVPVTLLVACAVLLLVLLAAIGAPLLAVALVLAIVASPLLVLVWLVWLMARRRPSATIDR